MCYKVPSTHQAAENHVELLELPSSKDAVKALSKIGHYRTLTVTLDGRLASHYADEENKFLFKDVYLEESEYPLPSQSAETEPNSVSTTDLSELLKMIRTQERSEEFGIGDV